MGDDPSGDGEVRAAGEGPLPRLEGFEGASAAATLGMLASGSALVLLLVPGPGSDHVLLGYPVANPVRIVAGVGTVAFAASRRDLLDGPIGGIVGAIAGAVVLAADTAAMFDALTVWIQPAGLPVAGLVGAVAVGAGLAEATDVADERVWIVSAAIGSAIAFGLGGFLSAALIGALSASLVLEALGTRAIGVFYLATTIGTAIGFVVVALAIVRLTGRDRSFVDLTVPSLRHVGFAVLGIFILLVLNVGASALLNQLDAPFAQSQVEQAARDAPGAPTFLLWLVPLSWLAIAPAEELFFRNVVQKDLYGSLGRIPAVVAASGIFAGMHLPQYANADPAATAVSLSVVFLLALILGLSYERTDNLLVPILIHGTFNAIAFYGMYVRVTAGTAVG